MTLKTDLESQIAETFREKWSERDGRVVPTDDSLKLSNDAVSIDAVVLYADLADSTEMVDTKSKTFAAEIYKSFLRTASKIIVANGGSITAFDGDRVMAVFLGDKKNTSAVTAGLQINWACKNIIQPALTKQYTTTTFRIKHVVGIDRSQLFVVRGGIRGANDLVWVGRAANYAAKLSSLPHEYQTYITKSVFDMMMDTVKIYDGRQIWEKAKWVAMNDMEIYRTKWTWLIN